MTSLTDGADLSHTRIGSATALTLKGTELLRARSLPHGRAADRPVRPHRRHLASEHDLAGVGQHSPGHLEHHGRSQQRCADAPAPMHGSAWVTAWYNDNGANYDWSRYLVLSDVTMRPGAPMVGGMQEFITTTPEPEAILLMGTGLLVLLAFARTRGNA